MRGFALSRAASCESCRVPGDVYGWFLGSNFGLDPEPTFVGKD
jgi:hypothetical protein